MNILKLEPGDNIVHDLYGVLTILERDEKKERYLVVSDEWRFKDWISFNEVEEFCQIIK